jgi:hypothetical protein
MSGRYEVKPNRRRFVRDLSVATAASPLILGGLAAHADVMRQRWKSAILIWLGGGASTIDMWDLKPGTENGGPFKPIETNGDVQICEHLPLLAQRMQHLAVIRSMSTREEDHERGRYYLHTGFMPSDVTRHPSYGAIVSKETISQRPRLELPPFVAIGSGTVGAGHLGRRWAPLHVSPDGKLNNRKPAKDDERLAKRLAALAALEGVFSQRDRGVEVEEHMTVVENTVKMLRSSQLRAFDVMKQPIKTLARYGLNDFGKGCLMARCLVEVGVPFVEIGFHGWDNHAEIFPTLKDRLLPQLDQGMSALLDDLDQRSLLSNTVVLCMGEFGRTPRINSRGGRDHWAKAWSAVLGGAGLFGGQAIGETSSDGSQVESEPYRAEDLLATVLAALKIPLETKYATRSGRELNIANQGRVIDGLGITTGQSTGEDGRGRSGGRELTDLIEEDEK